MSTRTRPLPSTQTLMLTGCSREAAQTARKYLDGRLDPSECPQTQLWLAQCAVASRRPAYLARVLYAIGVALGHRGVETLAEVNVHDFDRYLYSDAGDLSAMTLVYDRFLQQWRVCAASDLDAQMPEGAL